MTGQAFQQIGIDTVIPSFDFTATRYKGYDNLYRIEATHSEAQLKLQEEALRRGIWEVDGFEDDLVLHRLSIDSLQAQGFWVKEG